MHPVPVIDADREQVRSHRVNSQSSVLTGMTVGSQSEYSLVCAYFDEQSIWVPGSGRAEGTAEEIKSVYWGSVSSVCLTADNNVFVGGSFTRNTAKGLEGQRVHPRRGAESQKRKRKRAHARRTSFAVPLVLARRWRRIAEYDADKQPRREVHDTVVWQAIDRMIE